MCVCSGLHRGESIEGYDRIETRGAKIVGAYLAEEGRAYGWRPFLCAL
ncbi:hypothetical protein M2323_000861 [Rhodoblastus acidophilus]|nr:hypothetical protein [Rhodoblastus acidophilus]MCW2282992.1 hypothetical protein [Rhodoblastus acidophilus]MCW2331957.1 hypothetical protein [Rhodoblastus acidophilus]